jgi:hypothetical protein
LAEGASIAAGRFLPARLTLVAQVPIINIISTRNAALLSCTGKISFSFTRLSHADTLSGLAQWPNISFILDDYR